MIRDELRRRRRALEYRDAGHCRGILAKKAFVTVDCPPVIPCRGIFVVCLACFFDATVDREFPRGRQHWWSIMLDHEREDCRHGSGPGYTRCSLVLTV